MQPSVRPALTNEPASPRFFRIANVIQMTGLSRSTIYRLISEDQFPPPVRLTKRAVGWRQCDLEQWSSSRSCSAH